VIWRNFRQEQKKGRLLEMDSTERQQHGSPPVELSPQDQEGNDVLARETLKLLFMLSQPLQEEDVSFEMILTTVTDGVRHLLHADLCLLFLPERSDSLLLRGVSPFHLTPSLPFASVVVDVEALRSQQRPFLWPSTAFPQLNPLLSHVQSGIAVPLRVLHGRQVPGLLCCYFNDVRPLNDEQQHSVYIVAQQVAHLLFRDRVFDLLRQRYLIKSFIEQLLQQPAGAEADLTLHARFLNLDLERPHTVVFGEIRSKNEEKVAPPLRGKITSFFEATLHEEYPGSLLYDHDQMLTCLVDSASPTSAGLQDWLRDLSFQISSAYEVRLFTGISNPCQRLTDYRRASSEAIQALRTGYTIHPEGGVTHYNDIRIFEYLTIAPELKNDALQEQLEVLLHYDQSHKKKDRLLDTLEVYLQYQANMAKAGTHLRVHRNTVEQRLKRIKDVAGLDVLDADTNVFDLELALRVFKLRLHSHSDS
jgi:sugar diacid utilization regulator